MHNEYLEELANLPDQNEEFLDKWRQEKQLPPIAAVLHSNNTTFHQLWNQLKEQYQSQLLDDNRQFADIMLHPQSAAEMKLIEMAVQTLPPHELADAIINNLPASAVIAKIERFKIIKQNLEFSQLHQQRLQIIQNIPQKPIIKSHILAQEFGILNEISKNLSHADKIKQERENVGPETGKDVHR